MNNVLVLGAGLVAGPLVRYLAERGDFSLTVADIDITKAEALVRGQSNARAVALDVQDQSSLEELIAANDITVSLLPARMHPTVAGHCLEQGKHMLTASYIGPDMAALHDEAMKKGLTFVGECGLDPGIDHMSAMRVIDNAKSRGGNVVSFKSYCGGLPAPEANNPVGYKFSWAPRGVLTAATNSSRYLEGGRTVEIPGNELFASPEMVEIEDLGTFEGYPNRDALPYIEMYGLEGVRTMFRGTLRHTGHCESWHQWVKLGLFDQSPRSDLSGLTLGEFTASLTTRKSSDPEAAVALELGIDRSHPAISKLRWLGMFTNSALPVDQGGNIDVMAAQMLSKCRYQEHERDIIVLRHEFVVEYASRAESIHSTLIDYGILGGESAMARTVALPLAIATRMVAQGEISVRGVVAPVTSEIYSPILKELEGLGIVCQENTFQK